MLAAPAALEGAVGGLPAGGHQVRGPGPPGSSGELQVGPESICDVQKQEGRR